MDLICQDKEQRFYLAENGNCQRIFKQSWVTQTDFHFRKNTLVTSFNNNIHQIFIEYRKWARRGIAWGLGEKLWLSKLEMIKDRERKAGGHNRFERYLGGTILEVWSLV